MRNGVSDVTQVLGQDVSRETLDRLKRYDALLHKWNPVINLVSPRTLPDSWTRHIIDSVQVFSAIDAATGSWLDFGSGGGFPGLVCAIVGAELRPNIKFQFIESDRRKCAFLSTVLRETGVEALVSVDRVEKLPPQGARIVSARAVAPLTNLITYAEPHLAPDGECVFPKGARSRDEILVARQQWHFKLTEKPSITDPEAVILVLGEISRA